MKPVRTHGSRTIPAPRGAGIRAIALFLILSIFMGFAPTGRASAADDMPKLGIQPVGSSGIFFSEEIKAGKTKTLTVELSNAGKSDVAILTYAADAYSLVNGGFGVELSDDDPSGTTTWVDYPTQTIDLPHGEGRQIEFTVAVPKETAPGEYLTSLVIQNAEPIAGAGDVSMNQILRQAIAIAITVPGDQHPGIEIGAISYHDNPLIDSIMIDVHNTGNIHLKPVGKVEVKNAAGASVLAVDVAMDSVYAGTSTQIEIGLTNPLASGDYTVSVQLADANRGGSAEADDVAMPVVDTAQASTAMRIDSLEVTPIRASDDAPVQFANVAAAIDNPGAQIPNGQIMLHVERDGVLVEDYPLTMAGPIDIGPTAIQQRYLPITGWQPGVYTFTVQVLSIDPTTGEQTVLVESDAPATLEIT